MHSRAEGRLRNYLRPSLLAIDEVGYLAYDADAVDEIIAIDGESYRKREAEQAQKRKQEQKPKR